jgi:hypothetical protein
MVVDYGQQRGFFKFESSDDQGVHSHHFENFEFSSYYFSQKEIGRRLCAGCMLSYVGFILSSGLMKVSHVPIKRM